MRSSKIAETKSLLDLTINIGISSTGRLHDLFVKLEAMSLGEFKATKNKPLVVCVKGTNFQIQVWRALFDIPFAGMATYHLATAMGGPTAARAIALSLGSNPVGYLIPCHRVIRESAEMGGFRWGLERKTVMLGWEASCDRNIGQDLT